MVVPLGPGKFYGSALPRPRFYTDVKFAPFRVDPPATVSDPLLSWAHEAHWSMGGLSFKRLRLQGRIEGNVNKLCAQRRKSDRLKRPKALPEDVKIQKLDEAEWEDSDSESEPEPEPEKEAVPPAKEKLRKRARKLVDEFELAADADRAVRRTRSKKPGPEKAGEGGGAQHRRTSPRESAAEGSGAQPRRTSPRKSAAL